MNGLIQFDGKLYQIHSIEFDRLSEATFLHIKYQNERIRHIPIVETDFTHRHQILNTDQYNVMLNNPFVLNHVTY